MKSTLNLEVIHVHETGCQSGVRSCSMPGLPRHLVQELNVGTVGLGVQCGKDMNSGKDHL